jgi:hypothetical protein
MGMSFEPPSAARPCGASSRNAMPHIGQRPDSSRHLGVRGVDVNRPPMEHGPIRRRPQPAWAVSRMYLVHGGSP